MKSTRHTLEQIIRKLRQAEQQLSEGQGIAEVCRGLEISEATFHRWRNRYGVLIAGDEKRLKELQTENAQLKEELDQWALTHAILDLPLGKSISRPS